MECGLKFNFKKIYISYTQIRQNQKVCLMFILLSPSKQPALLHWRIGIMDVVKKNLFMQKFCIVQNVYAEVSESQWNVH